MVRVHDYLYIASTVLLTVYGQIILKWRIGTYGALPEASGDKLLFVLRLLLDPYIFSGFLSAFLASLTWMAALTKFELGLAYPLMSLSFVVVTLLGAWFLNEGLTVQRLFGVALIVFGTAVVARS